MSDAEYKLVPTGALVVDPNQPRRDFGREAELKENRLPLEALASSIKDLGILQPILARNVGAGKYMIIAGERRWRAAQMAGLSVVPVLVRENLSGMNLELAQLAENLQREDLTDLDVATTIGGMMKRYPELRKKDLAKLINRSPSYITRMLAMIDPQWSSLVLSNVITYASVLEAFKGKSQAVRDLALSASQESGKSITHDGLRAAERQLLRSENAVRVEPELYDRLMADMGFDLPGTQTPAELTPKLRPSSAEDFNPPPGSRPASSSFAIGGFSDRHSDDKPSAFVHQAKMGWESYQKLLALISPKNKPVLVEVHLNSDEIQAALAALGSACPREEFEQLPALMSALRLNAAPSSKKPKRG